jgi:hypothetical protein
MRDPLHWIALNTDKYHVAPMFKIKVEADWLIIIASIVLPIFIGFTYVLKYGVNVPWNDEFWLDCAIVLKYFQHNLTFMDFFIQHNEHRVLFPRLIMLFSGVLTKSNMVSEMILSLFIYSLAFFMIFLMYKRDNYLNKVSLLAFIPLSWYFFNLFQMKNMLFGTNIASSIMVLGFLATVYLIDSSKGLDKRFIGSLVTAFISSFSFISGLNVWPTCVILLFTQEPNYKLRKLLVWVVAAILTFGLYFYEFHNASGKSSFSYIYNNPLNAIEIFFASLGLSLINNILLSPIIGMMILVMVAYIIILSNSSCNQQLCSVRQDTKWICLIFFSILSSMEIMFARTMYGIHNAVHVRYFFLASLCIIGIYCVTINIVKRLNQMDINRKCANVLNGLNWPRDLKRISANILFILILISILVNTLNYSIEGAKAGPEIKLWKFEMAYYLKTYEIQPTETLGMLLQPRSTPLVRSVAQLLENYNLSVFAEKEVLNTSEIYKSNLTTLGSIDRINDYPIRDNATLNIDDCKLIIYGWAVDEPNEALAKAVFITVDDHLDIPAFYGLTRTDVSNYFSNTNYENCGFKASFTPYLLMEPGIHELSIKILSYDGCSSI